jgi:antitoxin ParD1/3/4
MTTLNISLPDSMRTFIDQKVAQGGYSTASEYIRQLVREDQKHASQERLEELLIEGIESEERIEGTPEYWAEKRAQLLNRIEEKNA